MFNKYWIAHKREDGSGVQQSVGEHNWQVAYGDPTRGFPGCKQHAAKFGIDLAGELAALLHDQGKYTEEFLLYILGKSFKKRGEVHHSPAGALYVWRCLNHQPESRLAAQMIAMAIISHHSGLIDAYTPKSDQPTKQTFYNRMASGEETTRYTEALANVDEVIKHRVQEIISSPDLIDQINSKVASIYTRDILCKSCGATISNCSCEAPYFDELSVTAAFELGLLARGLLSCLLDGDRMDTSIFMKPHTGKFRNNGKYVSWGFLEKRLNKFLKELADSPAAASSLNQLRNKISDECFAAADLARNIFLLHVPTGGGKTITSLRWAIRHAMTHNLDRIIYVLPFTTVIDQNADDVKNMLGLGSKTGVVLEHHSNLTPDDQNYKERLMTENWDAPIVFTTSVQIMKALFGGKTQGARRMHQLANSLIIFDEVQAIGIKNFHMICNALNFLVHEAGSSVVLCTATQPILDQLNKDLGAVQLNSESNLIKGTDDLFHKLRRVHIVNKIRAGKGSWTTGEVADLMSEQVASTGNCLTIVNTRSAAREVYDHFVLYHPETPIFHLSTDMCPFHRKEILAKVQGYLKSGLPVACVSTQLIEAGINIDFNTVIRSLAGLDSLAQAAGRCNRNARLAWGTFIILNINEEEEIIRSLPDIKIGKEVSERIIREHVGDLDDLFSPASITKYFQYYLGGRSEELTYPLSTTTALEHLGYANENLLNLLSINNNANVDIDPDTRLPLCQAFSTANNLYRPIENATRGVIVPYKDKAKQLLVDLAQATEEAEFFKKLKYTQQYSVNIYIDKHDGDGDGKFSELIAAGRIKQLNPLNFPEVRMYCLTSDDLYDENFGLMKEFF